MNLKISKTAKIVAGVVGFAMVMGFVATPVKAQTTDIAALQAMIAQLTAQIAALQGGSSSMMTGSAPMAPLTMGSSGAEVTKLQNFLISKGFGIAAGATGYFGGQTQSAVMAFQSANGITPASGYYGSLTASKVASMMTSTTGTPSTPSTPAGSADLEGTDGSISDVSTLSQYSNEEVGDGESEVKVVGFEVEASKDGDIALKSMKLHFTGSSNTGSKKLDDYVETVKVWMGSQEIGSADASDFNKDSSGVYTKTVTLKSGVVVKADETEKFYITVDAVSNLDSNDVGGDAWTLDVDNIRFTDGSGVTTTDVDTGDINAMNVSMNFVTFSASADTELKFTTDSSNNPEAGVVMIDDTEDTDGVELLAGKIEVEGTSDVWIDSIPFVFTTTADSLSAVAGSVTLTIDGEEFTESVNTSNCLPAAGGASCAATQNASIAFDNLDFTIGAGDTVSFTVSADINDVNDSGATATDLDEGDTLTASMNATTRGGIDAENEEGDQLVSSERSGTVTGNAQEFRTSGIQVSLSGTPTTATTGADNNNLGTFTIKFNVKAVGDTVYVASAASNGVTYSVDLNGTATSANSITASLTNADTDLTSTYGLWEIEEGDSEEITLTVSVPLGTGSTDGAYRAALTGVKWGTASDDVTPNNTYTSNLDTFKTPYQGLI